jgi:hypothetical protein
MISLLTLIISAAIQPWWANNRKLKIVVTGYMNLVFLTPIHAIAFEKERIGAAFAYCNTCSHTQEQQHEEHSLFAFAFPDQ